MSDRDRRLISATGYSVAQIADILDKSRQTVSRGVKKQDDYFAVPELMALIDHFDGKGDRISTAILDSICANYPQVASNIAAAIRKKTEETPLGAAGEYWLICPDLILFRTKFEASLERVMEISQNEFARILVFCPQADTRKAQQVFNAPGPYNNIAVWGCSQTILGAVPIMIIHKNVRGGARMYAAAADGFQESSSEEVNRILLHITDNAEPASENIF